MKKCSLLCAIVLLFPLGAAAQKSFTIEQILSAPFPEELIAAKKGDRIAWTFNQEGKHNVWVAEGPAFHARRLTPYLQDDGQEITEVSFSEDGNTLVYTRGGEKNGAGQYPDPDSNPAGVTQTVWRVSFAGGEPKKVDAGHSAEISSRGMIAYVHEGQIWIAPADGIAKPYQIYARGQCDAPRWSPNGSQLAFVSARGDHGFIGVYDVSAKTVRFLSPTVDADHDPAWSLDGKRIAFVRQASQRRDAEGGFFLAPDKPEPWAIWVADVASATAKEVWHSTSTLEGSFPGMANGTGGGVLNWAADNQLLIASEQDGWQHLYALSADGGMPQLLTPGNCELQQWSLSADRKAVLFNSNFDDIDRRHLWRVSMSGGAPERLSGGSGIEWNPVGLSGSDKFAYIGSDATHPGRVYVRTFSKGDASATALAPETWPKNFPSDQLVTPQQVIFSAPDGLEIHGQLFLPPDLKPGETRPAAIFMHGGPIRQMLLGFHYMFYYSNSYGMNQYLASKGYVVLAVNYRSGIGYGRSFREAVGRAARGATEYQDIVAAGKYLRGRPEVDAARIGLWGGSYGGYLTAMGLGRNSDMFAAGVDVHGVHDWRYDYGAKNLSPELMELARQSSPVASVEEWKSPVLFIHGDDDRNVPFTQSVDLIARLRAKGGVTIEQLVFPDEIHDFLLYRTWVAAYKAASDFFDRRLKGAAH
jgi:dipeptidyl aminopeptidase/acylaminoacyl peptidase